MSETTAEQSQNSKAAALWQKMLCIADWKIRMSDKFLAPLADLGLRVAVGLVFFKSGKSKLLPDCEDGLICVDPQKANLFEWEYIPNWEKHAPFAPPFDAATMASLTTWAELILPVMLILGLGGRVAAFGLLMMSLVIEFWIYPGQYVEHWYWIVILFALLVRGPGALSPDHLVRRKFLPREDSK